MHSALDIHHTSMHNTPMNISKDLVAASATPLVLAILRKEESYGYAIIQQVRTLSEDRLRWTDGMLYPVLHRLERQGLVRSRWGESPTKRRRKYYRLTASGVSVLEEQKRHWKTVHDALRAVWERTAAGPRERGGDLCLT